MTASSNQAKPAQMNAPAPPMEFKWLGAETPYLVVGAVGNVVVSAWRTRASTDELRAYRRALFEEAERWPQGVGAIVHLGENMAPPDNTARDLITALLRDLDSNLIAYATIMKGEGFLYAGLRALSSTFTLLSRNKAPQKFLSSIDEGVSWISPHLDKRPPRPSSEMLRSGLHSVVDRLGRRPPP